MSTLTKKLVSAAISLSAITGASLLTSQEAHAVFMPAANCGFDEGSNCLEIGDFNVYSLPLLNLQAGFSAVPGPGDPYYASSTFGAIQGHTIVGINNGQDGAGNVSGQVDGSYNTPSQQSTSTFSTVTSNPGGVADPGGAGEFFGDSENSWDARTATILEMSQGTPLVFFFAFNETGSGKGLLTTDLLIWGKITLLNEDDPNDFVEFFLGGDPGGGGTPLMSALPDPDGANNVFGTPGYSFGPWVYVHSGICTDADANFVGYPDSAGNCAVGTSSDQSNLGQNAAAFMVNSPGVDEALMSGAYSSMQVTWEMAYINGGGETAWIMPVTSAQPPIPVPEPGVLSLLGLSMLLLGGARLRSRIS